MRQTPGRALRIAIVSHTPLGGGSPFVIGSHHYARELDAMGHSIDYFGLPIRPARALAAAWNRDWGLLREAHLRRDGRIRHISPVTLGRKFVSPGRMSKTAWSISPSLAAPQPRSLRRPDLAIVDYPAHLGLIKWLEPQRLIYRPTDIYEYAAGSSREARRVVEAEGWLTSVADGVIGTSRKVVQRLETLHRCQSASVLENGVDTRHFAAAYEARKGLPLERIALYVGAMDNQRFDWGLLEEVAERSPDVSILLIGPSGRQRTPKNVISVGPVAYDLLPQTLARGSVGILPFRTTELNHGRSPMKLYEYIAAGLRVVSTPLDEIRRRRLDGVVDVAATGQQFADAVVAAIDRGPLEETLARSLTEPMSWERRALILLERACEGPVAPSC